MIVPEDGIKDLSALTVNTPATENEAVGWDEGVPAIVKPLNVNVPELTMDQPVPDIVMVPADGIKDFVELTVNAPATENELADCTKGVPEMVKFLNVSVPSLTMDQQVVVMVMVPEDGANILSAFTVNIRVTEKEAVGWTEGVSAMVKS